MSSPVQSRGIASLLCSVSPITSNIEDGILTLTAVFFGMRKAFTRLRISGFLTPGARRLPVLCGHNWSFTRRAE